MKFLTALTLLVFLASCNTQDQHTGILNTDSLIKQQFTIDPNKDTLLQTAGGALLQIPAGALTASSGSSAMLEIREAYTMAQMIKAGLTTMADGQPLSSGGMIYINGAGGQNLTIAKPIKVAMPTDNLTNGMQLYKGEKGKDGKINWTNPQPLPENKQLQALNAGKALFQSSCATCHGIGQLKTGPDLAHFEKRIPYSEKSATVWTHGFNLKQYPSAPATQRKVEKDYITDSTKQTDIAWHDRLSKAYDSVDYKGGIYWCNLKAWSQSAAPPFPSLPQQDWKNIYDYVQSESDRRGLPLPPHAYLWKAVDSCELYRKKMEKMTEDLNKAETKRSNLIDANSDMVERGVDTTTGNNVLSSARQRFGNYDSLVSPAYYGAEYYQFNIESTGWYNIDRLTKDIPGIEPSMLFVNLKGKFKDRANVYLILPSVKVNIQGGKTANADQYAFNTKDGQIPLPQGEKGYILAISEQGDSLAYALKEFTVTKMQTFDIELQETTKQAFTSAMEVFDKQDLHIKVADARNATEIRAEDKNIKTLKANIKEAEKLKPQNVDCSCGEAQPLAAPFESDKSVMYLPR